MASLKFPNDIGPNESNPDNKISQFVGFVTSEKNIHCFIVSLSVMILYGKSVFWASVINTDVSPLCQNYFIAHRRCWGLLRHSAALSSCYHVNIIKFLIQQTSIDEVDKNVTSLQVKLQYKPK